MKHQFISILAFAAAASCAASAQTIIIPTNYVSSGFLASFPAGTSLVTITGSVAYDVNLSPASLYVGAARLSSDAQSLFMSYPSPQDPIEAIASSVMTSLLQKYPQINGGTLGVLMIQPTNPLAGVSGATVTMGTIGHSQSSGGSTAGFRKAVLANERDKQCKE